GNWSQPVQAEGRVYIKLAAGRAPQPSSAPFTFQGTFARHTNFLEALPGRFPRKRADRLPRTLRRSLSRFLKDRTPKPISRYSMQCAKPLQSDIRKSLSQLRERR